MAETVLRNNIQSLLDERGMTISDLQRLTQMSYPATHNIVRSEIISDETRVGTLRKVAEALGVQIGDLLYLAGDESGDNAT